MSLHLQSSTTTLQPTSLKLESKRSHSPDSEDGASLLPMRESVQTDLFNPLTDSQVGRNRFVVIGDAGTGTATQFEIGRRMAELHTQKPFASVLVLGDNAYKDAVKSDNRLESGHPGLFEKRIREPYNDLFQKDKAQRVKFYPVLGNHDVKAGHADKQLAYWNKPPVPPFYNFKLGPKGSEVEFFAIDTTVLMPGSNGCYKKNPQVAVREAKKQLAWLEKALAESTAPMKVVFGHYTMFSKGAHVELDRAQTQEAFQTILAPMFEKYGVDLYLAGHEHHYEKPKERNGVYYAVSGAAGGLEKDEEAAKEGDGLIRQCHFLEFEITPKGLVYNAISDKGKIFDSGLIPKQERAAHSAFQIEEDPWGPSHIPLRQPVRARTQASACSRLGNLCSSFGRTVLGCFQAIASYCPSFCRTTPAYKPAKDEAYIV